MDITQQLKTDVSILPGANNQSPFIKKTQNSGSPEERDDLMKSDLKDAQETRRSLIDFCSFWIQRICENVFCMRPSWKSMSTLAENDYVNTADEDYNVGSDVDAIAADSNNDVKTNEGFFPERMRTKSVSSCNAEATIQRKKNKIEYLKDVQTECSALGKTIGKCLKLQDMVGDTFPEIKDFDEKDKILPSVMLNLRKILEIYLEKHDKGDVKTKVKQTPAVLKGSHSKDDAQQKSPSRKKRKKCGTPGVTGLNNLGNSCYMNSTIQCLNNTYPLVKFMTNKFEVDRNNRRRQLVYQFADLVKNMWSGEHPCISPECLKEEIGRYHPSFAGYDQQDSQEFLTYLLDELNEGLKKLEVKPQIQEQGNEALAISRLDHNLSNDTIVEELFQGQFKKTIICRTCSQQIVNNQTFMYLHVPIPNPTRCTLDDCVALYFAERRVKGNCMMPSPNCTERSDTRVKLEILKLPQILIIVLKRFGTVGEGRGWRKIDADVKFPMRKMDLSRFVTDPSQKTYDLYAVSNHNGSLASGHYWACCRNPRKQRWYTFNDSVCGEVSEDKVKASNASNAYVLYYESVDQSTCTPGDSSGSNTGAE